MPEKPTAAKVAKSKKPTKAAAEKKAVAEKVAKTSRPAAEKLPYNFRTRSLVSGLLKAIEDEESRKTARKELKELRSYAEIRDKSIELFGEDAFLEVLEQWFDAGEAKE